MSLTLQAATQMIAGCGQAIDSRSRCNDSPVLSLMAAPSVKSGTGRPSLDQASCCFCGRPICSPLILTEAAGNDAFRRRHGHHSNARDTGGYLMERLRELAGRRRLIGDVRGLGLFIGVELVRDRGTLEPAGDEASEIANRMKDRGVLLSTDGPFHNVLKIKPPMIFSRADADVLAGELDVVLAEISSL